MFFSPACFWLSIKLFNPGPENVTCMGETPSKLKGITVGMYPESYQPWDPGNRGKSQKRRHIYSVGILLWVQKNHQKSHYEIMKNPWMGSMGVCGYIYQANCFLFTAGHFSPFMDVGKYSSHMDPSWEFELVW